MVTILQRMYIGGRSRDAQGNGVFDVVDPSTGHSRHLSTCSIIGGRVRSKKYRRLSMGRCVLTNWSHATSCAWVRA